MRSLRTDLAMESFSGRQNIQGVRIDTLKEKDITQTTVHIDSPEAAKEFKKPCGVYITIQSKNLPELGADIDKRLLSKIHGTLQTLLPASGDVLVIGLGNRHMTADALGAKVVEMIIVTRHLKEAVSETIKKRLRGVCAAAPGVLGVTGIETAEVVKGLIERVKPSAVIAVDALAAMACERICTTVQITNTGISPGSGVGNHRLGLNRETLGVPVIAIGVPMVVYAATIARDAIASISKELLDQRPTEATLETLFSQLDSGPMGEMVVTPREIDALVAQIARTLALGINKALQPMLSDEEITQMMH